MKTTKVNKLFTELDSLKLGDSLKKSEYVLENWDRFDYFTKRSFDVALCNAKKMMPTKSFEIDRIKITRTL
jgi:hypothetical protein